MRYRRNNGAPWASLPSPGSFQSELILRGLLPDAARVWALGEGAAATTDRLNAVLDAAEAHQMARGLALAGGDPTALGARLVRAAYGDIAAALELAEAHKIATVRSGPEVAAEYRRLSRDVLRATRLWDASLLNRAARRISDAMRFANRLSPVLREQARQRYPFRVWVRKADLERADGKQTHIADGTRVRMGKINAHGGVYTVATAPPPMGSLGYARQSGKAGGDEAKRATGTNAAWLVEWDALGLPAWLTDAEQPELPIPGMAPRPFAEDAPTRGEYPAPEPEDEVETDTTEDDGPYRRMKAPTSPPKPGAPAVDDWDEYGRHWQTEEIIPNYGPAFHAAIRAVPADPTFDRWVTPMTHFPYAIFRAGNGGARFASIADNGHRVYSVDTYYDGLQRSAQNWAWDQALKYDKRDRARSGLPEQPPWPKAMPRPVVAAPAPVDPEQRRNAIKAALIALGWEPLYNSVSLRIRGGTTGGMMNAEGLRRVALGFAPGAIVVTHGDTRIVKLPENERRTADQIAEEIDRATRAQDRPAALAYAPAPGPFSETIGGYTIEEIPPELDDRGSDAPPRWGLRRTDAPRVSYAWKIKGSRDAVRKEAEARAERDAAGRAEVERGGSLPDTSALSKELRILGDLSSVRYGYQPPRTTLVGPDWVNYAHPYKEGWIKEHVPIIRKGEKARDQYRPRALAALHSLSRLVSAMAWHPSQGSPESWEQRLAWAREPAVHDYAAKAEAIFARNEERLKAEALIKAREQHNAEIAAKAGR